MNLRRTRLVMTLLFGGIVATFAIAPLWLWRAERVDAISRDVQDQLVGQMADVFLQELNGQRPDSFPTWYVNVNDGWVDPYIETDLEPPLFGWVRDAGLEPSFRSYSLDGDETYLAYIRPKLEGQGYVTVVDTADRDGRISLLKDRKSVV